MQVLVAGATGYIGNRLIPLLVSQGHRVRCLVRREDSSLPPEVEVAKGNLLEGDSVPEALRGVDVAYYLVHSMGKGEQGFAERDRIAAFNFAVAAKEQGVQRVIYLGGLGSSGLSEHLKSRQETGSVLRAYGPPLIEFRAGIVVGAGSASFEIIRDLAEKLPVMICPQWVTTKVQPIAVTDVLEYLLAALHRSDLNGAVVEIGGASVESYRSMILGYAAMRGLRRFLLQVPVLTPRLSSYWLYLVTSIPSGIARPLVEGLRSEVICRSPLAKIVFPKIQPIDYEQALRTALRREDPGTFTKAFEVASKSLVVGQGLVSDCRKRTVHAPVSVVRDVVHRLGGKDGWPFADSLWQLRGLADTIFGGVGMRRSAARQVPLAPEDTLDFWRVVESSADRLLLRAEMKVPGKAWLQFHFARVSSEESCLRIIASFEPRGVFGQLYWWLLYPLHTIIFHGMLNSIARRAETSYRATKSVVNAPSKLLLPRSH